jgi:hypothetical protein
MMYIIVKLVLKLYYLNVSSTIKDLRFMPSELYVLPASSLISKMHAFLTDHYWLNEDDVRTTTHWLISSHLSKLGLFQVDSVVLTNNISNSAMLISNTRWLEADLYRLFITLSGRVDFKLIKMIISDTDIYVWGINGYKQCM